MDKRDQNREAVRIHNMVQLLGRDGLRNYTEDSDFAKIRDRLIYGEIMEMVDLSHEQIEQISIVALSAISAPSSLLKEHISAALSTNLKPQAIKETVYQCAPFIGIAKVESSLEVINDVFTHNFIMQDSTPNSNTSDHDRFSKGKEIQNQLFDADIIDFLQSQAFDDEKFLTIDLLSSYMFGDFYTRDGLSLKEREFIAFSALVSIGDSSPQLRAHIKANLDLGTSLKELTENLAVMMPYIGFTRVLNALSILREYKAKV